MKQEQLMRKVTPIGNGAHIFTPKEWLGDEVAIVRTPKKPLKERILSVLEPYLEHIEGAYLYGSRARKEETRGSDIDLFLISSKKLHIKEKGFAVIALEKKEMKKAIKIAPILIYSMLAESLPIINSKLLKDLKEEYRPKPLDFSDHIQETKRIIRINDGLLKINSKKEMERTSLSYSVVLRLRSIFIIKNLLENKVSYLKDFHAWNNSSVPEIDYSSIYNAYKLSKEKGRDSIIKTKDLIRLNDFLKQEVIDLDLKIHGEKSKKAKKDN